MKAVLLRTGSIPTHSPPLLPGSPQLSLFRHGSFSVSPNSNRISLHSGGSRRRDNLMIWRTFSENEVIKSETRLSGAGSCFFSARFKDDMEEGDGLVGVAGVLPSSGIPEEAGFSGGGFGEGKNVGVGKGGGGGNDGDFADLRKIGDHYRQMLKSNPGDSLLLRNYGKYLHEVEGDVEGAEEYYGRAILAGAGDAEVLSLYGKLIWDTTRDTERAKSYFEQAVLASPDDCMVMGSYAHFMWEAAEEEDEEEEASDEAIRVGMSQVSTASAAAMVAAF